MMNSLRKHLIDDADRYWSFLTVRFNLVVAALGAGLGAGWLAMGSEGQRAVLAFAADRIGWPQEVVIALALFAVAFIGGATLALRAKKQHAPAGPDTQPDWRPIDSTESPTVPNGDAAQVAQVNPGLGPRQR